MLPNLLTGSAFLFNANRRNAQSWNTKRNTETVKVQNSEIYVKESDKKHKVQNEDDVSSND